MEGRLALHCAASRLHEHGVCVFRPGSRGLCKGETGRIACEAKAHSFRRGADGELQVHRQRPADFGVSMRCFAGGKAESAPEAPVARSFCGALAVAFSKSSASVPARRMRPPAEASIFRAQARHRVELPPPKARHVATRPSRFGSDVQAALIKARYRTYPHINRKDRKTTLATEARRGYRAGTEQRGLGCRGLESGPREFRPLDRGCGFASAGKAVTRRRLF